MKLFTPGSLKVFALSAILFFAAAYTTSAQPRMVGVLNQGGTNGTGTFVRYSGGDSTVQVVYNFPTNSNIYDAGNGTPVEIPGGMMYGVNPSNGTNGLGTIYSYDYPTNTYAVKVNLDATQGYRPTGPLLLVNGLLYGVNWLGGSPGGTLFTYAPDSSYITKIADLPDYGVGSVIRSSNGKLYGITYNGYIYQYDISSGQLSTLYVIPGQTIPPSGLLEVGTDTLYGVLGYGGTNDGGVLFRYVIADSSYTVIYNFDQDPQPSSILTRASDGKLYGVTYGGGTGGVGNIYSYDITTGNYTDLYDFSSIMGGDNPIGDLYEASDHVLYGTTSSGNGPDGGVIFGYKISTSTYTELVDLTNTTGDNPFASGHFIEYIAAPLTTTQPSDQAICAGAIATFSAVDSGLNVNTQWQVSTDSGVTFNNISGATSDTLTFTANASENGYQYRVIFSNIGGNDTSATTSLTVYTPAVDTITAFICPNDSFVVGTQAYYMSGSFTDTLHGASVNGCDSIVTLNLTIFSPAVDTIIASICPGDSFVLGTQAYRTAGSFNDTFVAASTNGCDSTVTLNLTVFAPAVDTITASICPNDSFVFGSQVYYTAGFYNDTLHAASVNGCDSIITLDLSTAATVTPGVSISTNHSHTICVGTVITFTSHPTNGGSSPSYQWYVSGNPVSTSAIFVDSTLSNGDSVWVVMVSNASCATTDTVTSNVIPYVVDSFMTPGVTISSTNTGDTLCDNTMANLIAVGVNGGSNPDYQWQRNGVNVGNSDTYVANTILNGDVYTCIITSTAACLTQRKDTSSSITFTIIPYPSVSVSASNTKVCPGDSVSLTASGGSSYIWSTGDTTQSIYTTGGIYTVTATGDYGCTAGSSILTIGTVTSLTDSIRQAGDSLVSGPSLFFQWYYNDSIIGGAIGPVYIPTQSGEYQVAVIDSFGCVAYSEVINIVLSGVNTISADPLAMIYPNPNSGTFMLTLADQATHTITITDVLGRVVADGQKATHNMQFVLEGLTEGIYYLQIDNGRTIKFNVVR